MVESDGRVRRLRGLRSIGHGLGRERGYGEQSEVDPRGLPSLIPISSQYLRGIRAAIHILEFGGFPFATQELINHFQNYRGDEGEMVDPRTSKEKLVADELFKPGGSAIRAVMAVLQKTHTVVIPVTWDLDETVRMVENRVPTELRVLGWEQPYLLDAGTGSYKIIQLTVDLDAANIVVEDAKRDLDPNTTSEDPVKLTDLPTVFTNPEGTVLTEKHEPGLDSIFEPMGSEYPGADALKTIFGSSRIGDTRRRQGEHPEGLDEDRRLGVNEPLDETIGPWTNFRNG